MNSEGIQPYMRMYPFSPKSPLPSRLAHNIGHVHTAIFKMDSQQKPVG